MAQRDRPLTNTRRAFAWAILIVVALIVVRLVVLSDLRQRPDFAWNHADQYQSNAAAFVEGGHWHWTIRGVVYAWGGPAPFALPPVYSMFLSLFTNANGGMDEVRTAIVQIVFSAITPLALFWIALRLNGPRAALVAAALSAAAAVFAPAYVFVQEQLYGPLLALGLASLVDVAACDRPMRAWLRAGALMALATLTRAMSLYFVPVLVVVGVWLAVDRRRALRQYGAYVGGFLVLVAPYVLLLSWQLGQFVPIDNHFAILQLSSKPGGATQNDLGTSIVAMIEPLWRSPGAFVAEHLGYLTGQFKFSAGRTLQSSGMVAVTPFTAMIDKLVAHLTIDLVWAIAAIGAPLGFLFARERRAARILLLWVLVAVALTVAAKAGGPRYRTPYESTLLAFGAIAIAGPWRRLGRLALASAATVSVAMALVMSTSLSQSLRSHEQFGLSTWDRRSEHAYIALSPGHAAFNAYNSGSVVAVLIDTIAPRPAPPVTAFIAFEGKPYTAIAFSPGQPINLRIPVPNNWLYYVEIEVKTADGTPVPFLVQQSTRAW